MHKNELFDFMLKRVENTSKETGLRKPQAFVKWFSDLYFPGNQKFFASDGNRDGKVDSFFQTNDGRKVRDHIINSKFTEQFNSLAPPKFYEEVSHFYSIFSNKSNREHFIQKAVKSELRSRYKKLFEAFDEGEADLIFVTNHKKNEAQMTMFKKMPVKIFHLENILQFIIDDLDNAMPRTADLNLYDIHSVLSPDKNDTEVSTSIVFARLIDFIKYMEKDPNDLLFARNVRLDLGATTVNKGIKETFKSSPKEFAFSNNGITVLCESHTHNPGQKELEIVNPRVVNGSQTLHSVRDVPSPSTNARVMLRIIEIPAASEKDLPSSRKQKKLIVDKISLRSNQQNPIKLWNLVANDDYQLELFRYFRGKGFFYERREREFTQRSRELKSIQIVKGPSLKSMMQIIACYHWKNKRLGPGIARNLGKLFDSSTYEAIIETKPEAAYQLYLLNELAQTNYRELSTSIKKYQKYNGYINQAMLSILCKVLEQGSKKLGESKFTSILELRYNNEDRSNALVKLLKVICSHIDTEYSSSARNYLKEQGFPLSIANYFKNPSYMTALVNKKVPVASVARLIKEIFI